MYSDRMEKLTASCPLTCDITSVDVSDEESFGCEEDPLFPKPTSSSVVSSYIYPHFRNKPGRPKNSTECFYVPPQSTVVANFLLEKHKSKEDNFSMGHLDKTYNTMDQPWHLDDDSVLTENKLNAEYDESQIDSTIRTTIESISLNNCAMRSIEKQIDCVKLDNNSEPLRNLEITNEGASTEVQEKKGKLQPNITIKIKKNICDHCGYKAKSSRNLRTHYRTHSLELPYICPLEGCQFMGKNPNSLKYHKRTVHPTGDLLQCGIVGCEFTTLFPPTLRMHNLKKHSGDKPISCELCPYRCFINVELRKHMRTHSPLTPYACDFPGCSYSCKIASNLRKHKRSHTDERPYACEQCAFRSNFISSLKAHKRTHTGEKPYCCHQCGYRCNSASNLKKHICQKHKLKCGSVCKNGGEMYVSTSYPDPSYANLQWSQQNNNFKLEKLEEG